MVILVAVIGIFLINIQIAIPGQRGDIEADKFDHLLLGFFVSQGDEGGNQADGL